jgi:hypothetical protein
VREESQLPFSDGSQEAPRPPGSSAQSFVFPHRPSNEILVDVLEDLDQLRRVEDAVIVDPASHDRIDLLCEVIEGRAAPPVQTPPLDRVPDRRAGVIPDRWKEVDEYHATPVPCLPGPKRVPKEREPNVLMRTAPVGVLAVHDARLVQIQFQTDLRQPLDDRAEHDLRLLSASTVQDLIIRVTLERDVREFPDHPHIERVVEEEIGQHGRDSRALRASAIL